MRPYEIQHLDAALADVVREAKSRGVIVGIRVQPDGQIDLWLADEQPPHWGIVRAERVPAENSPGEVLASQLAQVPRRVA